MKYILPSFPYISMCQYIFQNVWVLHMYTGIWKVFWFKPSGSAIKSKTHPLQFNLGDGWKNFVNILYWWIVLHSAFKHVLNLQLVVDINAKYLHIFFFTWVLGDPCLVSAPNWSCKVIFQNLRMVELHPYLFPSTWCWAQAGAYTHTPVDALADESAVASACTLMMHMLNGMVWYGMVWTALV